MSRAWSTGRRSNAKAVVRSGWNRASSLYRPGTSVADVFGHSFTDHQEWLRPLFRVLPRGSEVLDLGCGCGVPDARLLSERFRVTGVDVSDVQIERAKQLVPGARFLRADMTTVRFPAATFAGIVCLYALIHVPLEEQRPLITRMYRWLFPGGAVLLTTGETAYTGVAGNWLGSNAKMYWSHADAPTYERWLTDAGFEVLRRTYVPEGGGGHALFLARKPGDASLRRVNRYTSTR
jgi:ubiquinone/menaquinone biosynthesis C-methylase UbiE